MRLSAICLTIICYLVTKINTQIIEVFVFYQFSSDIISSQCFKIHIIWQRLPTKKETSPIFEILELFKKYLSGKVGEDWLKKSPSEKKYVTCENFYSLWNSYIISSKELLFHHFTNMTLNTCDESMCKFNGTHRLKQQLITAWKVSKYWVISGPYFPVFGLNTETYEVNLCIQSKYRKIRTRNNSVFGHFLRSDKFLQCNM